MSDSLSILRDSVQLFSYIVVFLGVPVALYKYWRAVKREQLDREYGTYNALDDKYIEFQRLCLERPHLDVFDVPDAQPTQLTGEQKKEELILFTMLFSIFERAYLMYHRQSSGLRQRQWSGWEDYIRSYARRANFLDAFRISGATFDTDFQEYMGRIIGSVSGDQGDKGNLHYIAKTKILPLSPIR